MIPVRGQARRSLRLRAISPELEDILSGLHDAVAPLPASSVRRETIWVVMRDGMRLATDLYLPAVRPAPTIAMRTPYGRKRHEETFATLARHGYAVVSQDCRGTGDSEPDAWDTYIYEREDSYDLVEWVTHQAWFDGFLGGCGGSYVGSTQWAMAMHPRMSAIAPEVAGLGVAANDPPREYMFVDAYSRSIGKGTDKLTASIEETERRLLTETLAGGYYNEPLNAPLRGALLHQFPSLTSLAPGDAKRWLWDLYRKQTPAERARLIKLAMGKSSVTLTSVGALGDVFGHRIPWGLPIFAADSAFDLVQSLHAPALVLTGWYDWGLRDTLSTWRFLAERGSAGVRSCSRLVISPGAHNRPGYREGREAHPELDRIFRLDHILPLLLRWYATIREDRVAEWPDVIYYLMGANEWRAAGGWPVPEARARSLYLGPGGTLLSAPLEGPMHPDRYTYDPANPTPTIGGSILSHVYPPGSVDVSHSQERPDVLVYSTEPLQRDLDVVGPLRLILYASSSAVDTDFSARLSDVFPDGRAIQLQNGILRARYRDPSGDPSLLQPGRIYRLELDMWATANRFKAGHRLRLDVSSADFPRFDRNANRGGADGPPIAAKQSIYRDSAYPSHLCLMALDPE